MHTIMLQSVDSRQATEDELNAAGITADQIPPDWRMMAHQAATVRALRFGDAPIVINRAMTGDGKTFAGQFMLFNEKWATFAMYPTNELARDQQRSLEDTLTKWQPPRWSNGRLLYNVVNATRMDEFQEAIDDTSRMDALAQLLGSDAVLTNPDIFHLAAQFRYTNYGAARDIILGELADRYRLFVFDEFHLFGTPQIASVIIAMLLMLEVTKGKQPPRFLFLSATPRNQLLHLAAIADLKIENIGREYQYGYSELLPGWRRILQPVTLTLHAGQQLEMWMDEHLHDIILPFFANYHPGAKGVIIANSVATAQRIYRKLQASCREANIHVGINTGITPLSERGTTDDYDLIVATSTIDVGVDFHINLLIFESVDAASHMQRLGRLGRHKTDRDGTPFECFEAHAILPDWVVEAIKAKYPVESSVSREDYHATLEEAFTPFEEFDRYIRDWAGVQAAHVLDQLKRYDVGTQYAEIAKRLFEKYRILFPGGVKKFRALLTDKREATLEAARSFRGSSPFTALVLDLATQHKEIVPYNLVTLLRHAELEGMGIAEILRYAERQGQNRKALERSKPLAAYKLLNWLSQPRRVQIFLDAEPREEQLEVVVEMTGFHFDVPDVPELNRLNRTLERQRLVALLLPNQDPEAVRKRLRLGLQLELFRFTTANGIEGCVAFDRHALLLDSAWSRRKRSSGGSAPIIL